MVRTRDLGDIQSDEGRVQRYSISDEKNDLMKVDTSMGFYSAKWDTEFGAKKFLRFVEEVYNVSNLENIRVQADYKDENGEHQTFTGRLKRIQDQEWFPSGLNFIEIRFAHIDVGWIDRTPQETISLTVYESNSTPIERFFKGSMKIPRIRGDAGGDKANEIAEKAIEKARELIRQDVSV